MIVKGVRVFFVLFLFSGSISVADAADVAVLTAFGKDLVDLGRRFAITTDSRGTSTREFGSFAWNGRTGVVAVCGAGLQESAVTCDTAIMRHGAQRVLSIGVAGALTDAFAPGDVIIVTNVLCSDRGTWTDLAGFTSNPQRSSAPLLDGFLSDFRSCLVSSLAAAGVVCKEASLVSGNSFVASSDRRAHLAEQFSADIVDMNSAGLIESCSANRIPLMIIRVVSDRADENARADFDAFAARREEIRRVLDILSVSLKSTPGIEE